MLDHLTLTVRDLAVSRAFYEKALAPLGYSVRMEFPGVVGFGDQRKPYFWLKTGPNPQSPMHLAFQAHDRKHVDLFHAAALAAGGVDDGRPGLRGDYHPNYYASFVKDPDGHPIEAVCHSPIPAPRAKAAPAKKRAVPKKKAGKAKKRR